MKKIIFLIGISILSLSSRAQNYIGFIDYFNVNSGHIVAANTTSTTINFTTRVMRQPNGGSWYPFYMNIKIGIAATPGGGTVIEYLSPVFTITSSDFSTNNTNFEPTYSFSVDNSKLTHGQYLILYYNIPNAGSTYYTGYGSYSTQISNPPPGPVFDPAHISKIQSMGFSTIGISDFSSNHYLVEGDVLIEKSSLSNSGTYSNIVSSSNDHNINISIDQSIWSNGSTNQGIYEAIKIWNSLANSNIKLHLVENIYGNYGVDPRVDIELKGDNGVLGASTGMAAACPSGNGNPGNLILVNTDFSQTYSQTTWNFIHAIGHALGLKHVVSDNNSVMRKGNFLISYSSPNFSFPSANDGVLITTMYPLNASSNIQSYIAGSSTNFSLTYPSAEANLIYTWQITGINGTNYSYQEIGNDLLWDLYLPNGNYKIDCTISNGKYSSPVTTTKNILIQ